MADEKQLAQPTPGACPKCKGQQILAEAVNTVRVVKSGTKLPGITGGFSEMWALVCDECGYTELYAKEPSKVA